MMYFGKLPDGAKRMVAPPPLSSIISSNHYPGYLRIAASELMDQSYATVGSVLTSMCRDDIMDVLEGWARTIGTIQQQVRDSAENEEDLTANEKLTVAFASTSSTFTNFAIFCAIVAKAECGEMKFDPEVLGMQVDLMQSFMKAYVLQQSYKDVNLDLPSLSLSAEFLNKNFDSVLNTQNYAVMKFVKDITSHWKEMKESPTFQHLMPGKPKKDDEPKKVLGYASDILRKALGKLPGESENNGFGDASATPTIEPAPSRLNSGLESFEEKLRRRLGR